VFLLPLPGARCSTQWGGDRVFKAGGLPEKKRLMPGFS